MPRKKVKAIRKPRARRRRARRVSVPGAPTPQTIRETLGYLSPVLASSTAAPTWPPDAFAVAAFILLKCGGYIRLVSDWPPPKYPKWIQRIQEIAEKWRTTCVTGQPAPSQVQQWWTVIRSSKANLYQAPDDPALCEALLHLAAAADEASSGAGIPNDEPKDDPFQSAVRYLLLDQHERGATLCKQIDKSKLRVLPKLHVPQSGMTIRSISHHLALCPAADVNLYWYWLFSRTKEHFLNLLLLPWPLTTDPSHFSMSSGTLRNMPDGFGFFSYKRPPDDLAERCRRTEQFIVEAANKIGPIHGVVLPELALHPDEFNALKDTVAKQGAFLLSGVRQDGDAGHPGRNFLGFHFPIPSRKQPTSYQQSKHHRWQLDKRQIVQYGLGAALDPSRGWWEHMTLEPRKLAFFAMRPWLTLCSLICEDLARQDPIAEILRAVGPNLVIALLMDGPQLAERWSSRYATVLADDPGSSVLTLTSLGMTRLSRPPDVATGSRVVGLWKDSSTGKPIPITLPEGVEAVVLSLVKDGSEEWTADGRSDGGTSAKPIFGGLHPIFLPKEPAVPASPTATTPVPTPDPVPQAPTGA